MDFLTMTEAFVVGGLLVFGLTVAILLEAARRRRKRNEDDGPG
jgi:hypothetical protein